MKVITRIRLAAGCVVLAPLVTFQASLPALAKVGVASVVNGEPLSKPASESERVLHIGNDMTANEVVTTRNADRAHIVFLDGSTLTVGPNSTISIDKFVYDPEQRTGVLDLRAGRGVFRYIGGAISKSDSVRVKTPSATIGIRGGIATIAVEPSGATRANFLFGGSLSITSQGVTQTTTQPSTQIAAPAGLPPTPPTPLLPGSLQQTVRSFQASGVPSSGSGAPLAAGISTAVTGSSLGQANSGIAPAAARAAIPATQQGQLSVAKALASAGAATAPAPGNQQGGPLQSAGPMQAAGPLQSNGPDQGTGPLQNAGPLAAATPFQETGPVGVDGALAVSGTQPGLTPPTAAVQPAVALANGLAIGDRGALQQLQNILGSPQGTAPGTLSALVGALTSATPAASTPPSPPASPPGPTGTAVPPPLAPTVYSTTTAASLSPN